MTHILHSTIAVVRGGTLITVATAATVSVKNGAPS